jgi:hypothetical protein
VGVFTHGLYSAPLNGWWVRTPTLPAALFRTVEWMVGAYTHRLYSAPLNERWVYAPTVFLVFRTKNAGHSARF